ncbi:type II secretion system protein GspL [Pseudomonas chlororaphis]|uniref:General secretion pathway protein GspL n=1 Tax=Pseudomonas chlororaphis TaxID=587753 RepID=A0A1Q8EJG9_9PSED|nr:type II secretion system protein GspL [Pseudomonas chlororaphis]OLF51919.1 general secretion pathway protein GspL [Pseudomonas chlororaphis]
MQAWLYLTTLAADDDAPATWWQTGGEPLHGTLQQAAVLAGQRLTLLLPAEVASHHRFDLPPRSGRWLQQAIHSVLEERLLDDPEQLHLARGPLQGRRHCRLFALQRQWLEQLLERLASHGLVPERIHVDADCLADERPLALLCHERWLIGGGCQQRLALDTQALDELAPLLPEDLQRSEQAPWPLLSQGSAQAIDLRQGALALRSPSRLPWRALLALLVVACSAQVAQDIGHRWLLQDKTAEVSQASLALWQQRFPDEPRVIDLARQVEARARQAGQSQQSLARRLDGLASQWIGSDGGATRIRRLDYQQAQGWTLQVSAPDFSTLERLREDLAQQGASVQADSAVLAPDGVSARLKITE